MTLIYEFDLGIVKTCTCTPKMNFLGQGFQKLGLQHEQDRHRHDRKQYYAAFAGGKECYVDMDRS